MTLVSGGILTAAVVSGQVIAIANDITHSSGSFGPKEDAVFRAATEHALALKLPVIYLAANSGARVGLAAEVKACLQVFASAAMGFIPPFPAGDLCVCLKFGERFVWRCVGNNTSLGFKDSTESP